MRKIISLITLVILLIAVPTYAAWTITVSVSDVKGPYVIYKLLCTSDGNALSATDFVALMSDNDRQYVERGASMLTMSVYPGDGDVAPDADFDITFTDIEGVTIFSETGFPYDEDLPGVPLWWDWWSYPIITTQSYLALSDIGTSGDQVTLYLMCYIGTGRGGAW